MVELVLVVLMRLALVPNRQLAVAGITSEKLLESTNVPLISRSISPGPSLIPKAVPYAFQSVAPESTVVWSTTKNDIPAELTVCGARITIVFSELEGVLVAGDQVMLSADDSHVDIEFQFPVAALRKYNSPLY